MQAYASYQPIKKPVIRNSFVIAFTDFTFSILSGFVAWSVIGFLQASNNISYAQTSSTGLTFIAFPVAATLDSSGRAWFGVFMFMMFMAGIDSAFSYMESVVTNIIDYSRCSRLKATIWVFIAGIVFSVPFCSNAGWLLLDLVDHYISDYILILVGLCQCISVGWIWEYESTAIVSPGHRSSLRWMTYTYWIFAPVITFNTIFGLKGQR